MFELSATSVFLGVVIFLLCFWVVRRPKNLPPGPWSLPIIGYNFKPGLIHEAYMDLAKKYGPIFSLRRGSFVFVILNDRESITQALVKSGEFFSDRFVPGHFNWSIPDPGKKGKLHTTIAFSNGKPWVDLRRFALPALRSFGFGKQSLVPQINLEARYLSEEIRNLRGEPTDLATTFSKATANIICQLLFSQRYEYSDGEMSRILKSMDEFLSLIHETDLVNIFETLIHTPRYKPYRESIFSDRDFIMSHLNSHRETFQKDNIRDFTDAFLADDISKEFELEHFWRVLLDFFIGGTDTTASVTSWTILFLSVHPDVQRKVQAELDTVVGRGRQPNTLDRPDLPYCNATLTEVMRIRPILPVSVPHMTSDDVSFRGFTIPKGSIIIPNLWAVHHDPKEWNEPDTFNPDRFLSADGKQFQKNEAWMPFGVGRRDCVGSQLAKMETFLLFTNLFQQFEFKLPPNQPNPSMRGANRFTMNPQPYKICAIER
ncbi:cytochrome P450 2J2 [Strongylocentrotus purpuratus]|uniref:Cytochrome P450 n=1 Tax=Strongylocentrotus purpuratus TaxID=7668 RepID=A0A7M7P3U9_STRPU|nr:cytochrome P450 2J2 [Strongylocentrotus purpuratus]